jgi:hypothetical protein
LITRYCDGGAQKSMGGLLALQAKDLDAFPCSNRFSPHSTKFERDLSFLHLCHSLFGFYRHYEHT